MDENKERRLKNIRQDIALLGGRLDEIEQEMINDDEENWQERLDDFIVENNTEHGTVTLAIDISGSMIGHKHLAHLLETKALELNNRDMSLICFGETVELYAKYLQTSEMTSALYGGSGNLLGLFDWLERNEIESPLVIFTDGILYPMMLPEVSILRTVIRGYNFPILYIFPSKEQYKSDIHRISQALDCVNIIFMTEGEEERCV